MISRRGEKLSSPMNSVSRARRSRSLRRSHSALRLASSRMYSALGSFLVIPAPPNRGPWGLTAWKDYMPDRRERPAAAQRAVQSAGRRTADSSKRYFRRKGLESSPVKPVTVRSSRPLLPSGTVTVIVLSSTWLNFAGLPGPNETPERQPASPKFSPVMVIFAPVAPSSGETFLIFGVTPEQLRALATLSAPEALVARIPGEPGTFARGLASAGAFASRVAFVFFGFAVSSAARDKALWAMKVKAAKTTSTRTTDIIVIVSSLLKYTILAPRNTVV